MSFANLRSLIGHRVKVTFHSGLSVIDKLESDLVIWFVLSEFGRIKKSDVESVEQWEGVLVA